MLLTAHDEASPKPGLVLTEAWQDGLDRIEACQL